MSAKLIHELHEVEVRLEVAQQKLRHAQLEVDLLGQRRTRIVKELSQPPLQGWGSP